ncbi:hypothetical protein NQZ68_039276 [Dissostichus eleginoides]|nr:hypothetical protein NQZ68_039276 [Dissostichus eleginoides]
MQRSSADSWTLRMEAEVSGVNISAHRSSADSLDCDWKLSLQLLETLRDLKHLTLRGSDPDGALCSFLSGGSQTELCSFLSGGSRRSSLQLSLRRIQTELSAAFSPEDPDGALCSFLSGGSQTELSAAFSPEDPDGALCSFLSGGSRRSSLQLSLRRIQTELSAAFSPEDPDGALCSFLSGGSQTELSAAFSPEDPDGAFCSFLSGGSRRSSLQLSLRRIQTELLLG